MHKIIFTEEFCQPENLHPFTLTRQIQDIRIGILSIREKWEKWLGLPSFDKWEDDYKDLERSIRIDKNIGDDVFLMIQGNVLPTAKMVKAIAKLKNGEFISVNGNSGIIFRFTKKEVIEPHKIKVLKALTIKDKIKALQYPWEIFQWNGDAIQQDFDLITNKRKSQPISKTNAFIRSSKIFIEKGAKVEHSILNATAGPIYIGKNAEVMEGCMIRGPFALGEHAVLKMGTKIYGATSIGPYSVASGEIKNSVMFGFSNKAHDGYLGDSVIGEWCNLGAGTTNSNLKNNAGEVRIWTPKGQMNAGHKCGVLMGDYSRTMINTAFNTGTVVGVSCNIFGRGLTPKYLSSFCWGSDGIERYQFDRALADIENWKKLKGKKLTKNEKSILKYIFEHY
ncbi:MAG TPA: putative sugar nucleotidyl transferase [Chitinophagaceae bacterium]|jgi:UDP-N-acetylglucosamine diphosphorylase/glucosamine-1-phosphate N-acetyltransferase|nr:putative sugar nucleotidyl transferase [Chitinophagaceae bacterium]